MMPVIFNYTLTIPSQEIRPLILVLMLFFGVCGPPDKSRDFHASTSGFDCGKIQKEFGKKLKAITCDKDADDRLVTDDVYDTYLRKISEFSTRNQYVDHYFHSVPDIATEKCLVVIKSVGKHDLYSYSYKLVELGSDPKVLLEVALCEDYPDGRKRISSIFLDDHSLRKTKVTESIGEYDKKSDSYQTVVDSVVFTFRLQRDAFILINSDSVRMIK